MHKGEEVGKIVRVQGSAPTPASTLTGFGSLRRSFIADRLCAFRADVDSGARTTGPPNTRRRILSWTMQES